MDVLFVLGIATGITTALFGFGGGFVTVPLLYVLLSQDGSNAMHSAVATSTCVMIFSALMASWRHHRHGSLPWQTVRPLVLPLAIGAALGALLSAQLDAALLRQLFISYLVLTLADNLLRKGFLQPRQTDLQPLSASTNAVAGSVIGVIAALLGVGGSVLTVPLMRRRGASMTTATALANPLTLPVAAAGGAVYLLLPAVTTTSAGQVGLVHVPTALTLMLGAWLGIRLASPLIGRIPDAVHAHAYLALLTMVLLIMVML